MNILQSKDLEALRLQGWVALRRSNAIKVEDVVVRLARQLGAPTPSRKGRGCVDPPKTNLTIIRFKDSDE